ncbi:glutamate racemase [Ignatzschineria sp. F8392]|uniref:glutamate racemase n=1 Tax=Ignatzschineria sp. F8392 TaxID=1980117 RepID=UPI001302EAC5|nr:glutamate racemase [Ignatzschineria sp. F8392]
MIRIGLIDSGIGGFSILNAFLAAKPLNQTQFIYIADSGHLPYGLKSDHYIHERMERLTAELLARKIDALVIACNTATAVSVEKLREKYPDLIIIGIEPAIKLAATATKSGHIAVAATLSTLHSERLKSLKERFAKAQTLHKIIGSEWVDLVEKQKLTLADNQKILEETLKPLFQYPIDQLVLGCTHFPFLMPALKALLPKEVTIIDPANAIVQECYSQITMRYPHRITTFYSVNDVETTVSKEKSHSIKALPLKTLQLLTTGELKDFQRQLSLLDAVGVPIEIAKIDT